MRGCRNVAGILALFHSLNEVGKTRVIVTRDPGVAKVGRRGIHMSDGQVVPPQEVEARISNRFNLADKSS